MKSKIAMFLRSVCFTLTASVIATGTVSAQSGNFPSKPVRLIIPFPPGGATDVLGRVIAEMLSKDLSQSFVVVNVGGASGSIGAMQVVRAPADGYTLLLGTPTTITTSRILNPNLGYDPLKDLQPISFLYSQPFVLVVNKDSAFRSLKDLIAEAKRQPGKLNYGSGGVGGTNHLAGELFALAADVKITHIPYQGAGPAVTGLMSNSIDMLFATTTTLTGNANRLVGLGLGSPTRSSAIPSVPTYAEAAGVKNYSYRAWAGLFAPNGIPKEVSDRLGTALSKGLQDPAIKARFQGFGTEPYSSSPAELRDAIADEYQQVKTLVELTGIKMN